jgi:hypothetical protein
LSTPQSLASISGPDLATGIFLLKFLLAFASDALDTSLTQACQALGIILQGIVPVVARIGEVTIGLTFSLPSDAASSWVSYMLVDVRKAVAAPNPNPTSDRLLSPPAAGTAPAQLSGAEVERERCGALFLHCF